MGKMENDGEAPFSPESLIHWPLALGGSHDSELKRE